MRLPIAVKGMSGETCPIRPHRCWRRTATTSTCRNEVQIDDLLGLCPEHLEELRHLSTERPSR